jgi:hypothetical protein
VSFQELELVQGLNQSKSIRYRDYFRAKQTARNTSIMVPPEFRVQYFTAIPYARMACQVISERIEIDSVKAGTDEATDFLRRVLKALGGAEFVNQAIMTAMEYGRAYLVPTGSERRDGLPGVQVIPGLDMVHFNDPYTGEILEALRVYGSDRTKRVYYTRTETTYLKPGTGANGWVVDRTVPTVDGRVACFPLVCRGEVNNTFGRPEAKDAFTLQDAACRIATDMAVASAVLATPQRVLLGAEAEDFTRRNPDGTVETNEDGTPKILSGEELYMSRLLTVSDAAAKIAEFSAAQLQNFTTALNAVTRQAAAVLGVPQSVFGVASDANPASGDAIRQDDARLIRRAEQLTSAFTPAWTGLFEYLLVQYGFGSQEVEIIWVDPSLPNLAARADAVFKLASVVAGGRPLYTWEELRKMLGDSLESIDKAKAELETNEIMDLILQGDRTNPNAPIGVAA